MHSISLTSDFFTKSTSDIAQALLGKLLVHETAEGVTVGYITETEAYLHDDPANHAYRGETPRTRVMFGDPGHAYVYFIYGMHCCLNITTGPIGVGEAVLLRSVVPIDGLALMQSRRGRVPAHALTNGPGKLCQAFGIDLRMNGHPMERPPLFVCEAYGEFRAVSYDPKKIKVLPRVGISHQEAARSLLRFIIEQ